jgi:hypothetical protein
MSGSALHTACLGPEAVFLVRLRVSSPNDSVLASQVASRLQAVVPSASVAPAGTLSQ